MFELFIETYEYTSFYTFYAALFLTICFQAFWLLRLYMPALESTPKKVSLQLSPSDYAYKQKSDLTTPFHIILLKKVKMKLSPDEDATSFSPI